MELGIFFYEMQREGGMFSGLRGSDPVLGMFVRWPPARAAAARSNPWAAAGFVFVRRVQGLEPEARPQMATNIYGVPPGVCA